VNRRYHLAIWIVIASEALLFSGLFALYWSYRSEYPASFSEGISLDIQWMGGLNTFILLTSSFAIAWAIYMMRLARPRAALWSLAAVIVLGLAFLFFKLFEWGLHIHEGLVPGIAYYDGPHVGGGMSLYFTLYYFMTGLHALHVIAGLSLVGWVLVRIRRGTLTPDNHVALEIVALYWHFVDVVWVFLWPMFYLMR
jgi:cytochrome c oxidase subunit III